MPTPPNSAHEGATPSAPLLLDVRALSYVLSRSVPSLHRDDSAGRLPAPIYIGGSTRWRSADIAAWVALGCPTRAEFEARRRPG
jgi:predicted DNA-binding transcriptional regulator AlpA